MHCRGPRRRVGASGNPAAHLHHEAAAHGVEGVGDDAGRGGHSLRDGPLGEEVGRLLVLEQHALGRVVQPKVGPTVHDDALRAGKGCAGSGLEQQQLRPQRHRMCRVQRPRTTVASCPTSSRRSSLRRTPSQLLAAAALLALTAAHGAIAPNLMTTWLDRKNRATTQRTFRSPRQLDSACGLKSCIVLQGRPIAGRPLDSQPSTPKALPHLHGDAEALIQRDGAAPRGHLTQAVDEARELTLARLPQVGRQARTCKVQRVHDQQRTRAGQTA